MIDERIHAKESKDIDLIDLFIEVILHWRGFIIATLIGGLLLGGYSVYGSVKANRSAKIAAAAAEQEIAQYKTDKELLEAETEKLNKRIETLKSTLSSKDLAGVAKILGDWEQLNIQREYMESSILMKADALNLPSGTITLRVIADQEVISSLKKSYEMILSSPEMYDVMKEKLTAALENVGIDSRIRAEKLSLEEFINLHNSLVKYSVYSK